MNDSKKTKQSRNFLLRMWDWFWTPTKVLSAGFVLLAGFLGGILFWGGFHWTLELTNTEEFCTGCHTMETNLAEYRNTIHYNNHSGVRAICSDCHVPHEWQHKIKAKIMAVKDVYHEIAGTISTPEKYEEHRIAMATVVWRKMKVSDSRECRNCHNFKYMDFTVQETRAASEHQRAIDNNMTCIDCHQGIAHDLPPGYQERYRQVIEQLEATNKKTPDQPNEIAEVRSYLEKVSN
ncbi:NapC/NirT family cytochrome c [Labrenzia sp. R4_1]|uniref:NapC/NirT family cytochrome c n=1 Tax=Stappiaceae TaxID=2821832 RepID=UPI00092A1F97|nr:NapC/NirT family cytochrome c [Labrenzia sp. R4_1]MBO9425042.1 NapC/NirT family cytochrome c [Labrenzia sp. R4_1]OJJ11263.1 4Fe-4S ferredoxin [Alphaproteobacteria bacterium AO1-B]